MSTSVLTPFSYAEVEIPEVIPENEVGNVEEIGETPEKDNEITGEIQNSLWEVEWEWSLPLVREVVNETSPAKQGENLEGLKEEVEDSLDAVESLTIDENKDEDTEKSQSDEVAQSEEENTEIEKQEKFLEWDEVGDDFLLQKEDEAIVIQAQSWTIATLLPWQQFNQTIKRLAWNSGALYYTSDSSIKQIVYTWTIPSWVTTTWISISDSEKEVVAWYNSGIIYYSSEAETIYMNSDSSSMFRGMSWLTWLDLNKLNTSRVTSMYYMFYDCENLTWLDLSSFDTSKVTSMNGMFSSCSKLTELDLSSWDTSNVTSMDSMFYGCSKLENLDLSNWNTNKVTNINFIFYNCNKLNQLYLSWWNFSNLSLSSYNPFYYSTIKRLDLSNATFSWSMYDVFYNMTNLEEINLSGADMSNVTNMSYTFYNCSNLVDIKWLDTWDTSNVTNMQAMFYNESSLTSLDLSSWDTSNVTDMSYMFNGCTNLTELNLDGWNFSKINSYYNYPFHNNSTIKRLSLSNAIFSWSMYEVFYNMTNLEEINLSGADMSNVTNMSYTFYNCSNLVDIKWLDTWDTSNVTNMQDMFYNDSSLMSLDLSNFDTSNLTNIWWIFNGCTWLEELNLSGWDLSKVQYVSASSWWWNDTRIPLKKLNMTNVKFSWSISFLFNYVKNLEELILDWVDTSNVTNMNNMFGSNDKLTSLDLSSFDTSNVTDMGYMFYNDSSLMSLDLSNFDTSNLTNIWWIFNGCTWLEELNLSGWDLSKVQYVSASSWWWNDTRIPLKKLNMTNVKFSWSMHEVFYNMTNLEELILDWVDTSNVINMNGMFRYSDKLTNLDLTSFDTSKVTDMNNMFNYCTWLMELDLSSFDTSEVTNMWRMFYNTPNLKTIYASDNFVTTALTWYYSSWSNMFYNSVNLIWWNGTKFDSWYIDKTYAKIDKVWQTWYFTNKNAITVKFINTLDGTETVATFAKWQKLTPPYVDRYHVVWWYLDEAMIQPIDLKKWVDAYSVIYVKYERNGSSGWWGGGWWWATKPDTPKEEQKPADTLEQISQNDNSASSWANVKIPENETQMDSQPSEQSSVEQLEWQGNGRSNTSDNSYTNEQKEAYEFAKENGITTKDTIQSAQMDGKLTRIAMAKMLSQYAINVLWQTPDTSKTIKFRDVTSKKDADYDNWVTLAYQLWIMWQNMPNNKFRPNDEVSRAEFVTALSRLLYQTTDWEYKSTSKYYTPHMAKLYNEWIINNTNPGMKERRWYVMIMLMRSAK